jgi:hypothetical protein
MENNFDAISGDWQFELILPLLNNYLESGLKLAVGIGVTSRPAEGCADRFIDGDVLDLELKIFEFLHRFLYGPYANNFT